MLHLLGLQLYRANLSQADHDSLPPAAQIDFDDAAVTPTLAAYNTQIPLSPQAFGQTQGPQMLHHPKMMRRRAIVSTTIVSVLWSKNGIATAVITLAHAAVHWSQYPRLHSLSTIYSWRSGAKLSPCCSNAPEDEGTDGLRDGYKLTLVDVRLFAVSIQLKAEARISVLS